MSVPEYLAKICKCGHIKLQHSGSGICNSMLPGNNGRCPCTTFRVVPTRFHIDVTITTAAFSKNDLGTLTMDQLKGYIERELNECVRGYGTAKVNEITELK